MIRWIFPNIHVSRSLTMPATILLDIPPQEQEQMLAALRRARYGYLLACTCYCCVPVGAIRRQSPRSCSARAPASIGSSASIALAGCLVNFPIYIARGAPQGHDSSVANFAQGAMKGQLPLSVGRLCGQGVEQFGRSEALFSDLYDHLFFL